MSYSKLHTASFGRENWCLQLQPLYNRGLLTSLSNGHIHLVDWCTGETIHDFAAHSASISSLKVLNNEFTNSDLFASASEDSVKIFDVRTSSCVATLHNDKSAPFLSLDSRHDMLACGTELSGVDAELHIYDIKKLSEPLRSFVDSHHDDVTDIKFHPGDPGVLMSGSTDGYVNIYDLTNSDEEDALHQVINFASIHSCGWLAPKRIYTLSHMETFAIHELNDKSDDLREPKPVEFGDVRQPWGCDYIVNVNPGFIAAGRSQETQGELKLIAFNNEKVDTTNVLTIPQAHGDEIIRDVLIPDQTTDMLYSCGEDGCLNIWKSQTGSLNISRDFWDYSKRFNVFEDTVVEVDMDDTPNQDFTTDTELSISSEEKQKEKKKKKDKKHKKSKKKKSHRYKPY